MWSVESVGLWRWGCLLFVDDKCLTLTVMHNFDPGGLGGGLMARDWARGSEGGMGS